MGTLSELFDMLAHMMGSTSNDNCGEEKKGEGRGGRENQPAPGAFVGFSGHVNLDVRLHSFNQLQYPLWSAMPVRFAIPQKQGFVKKEGGGGRKEMRVPYAHPPHCIDMQPTLSIVLTYTHASR